MAAGVGDPQAPTAAGAPSQTEIGDGVWPAVKGDGGDATGPMPGTYRVNAPPSITLDYTVSVARRGQPPAPGPEAHLQWRIVGARYELQIDGIAGSLNSEGSFSDFGVAPEKAEAMLGDGSRRQTSFALDGENIGFSGSERHYRNAAGSQDRAALLLQMAGMGRAKPEQMQGVLEFFVAGAADAGIVRFEVLGEESTASPLGALRTLHLAQQTGAGEAQLEVWLAPAHEWAPVQLRLTAPDGTVSTQLVSQITTPADAASN